MALVGNLIVDLVMLILASRWVQKEEQMELVRARWARMTKKLSGIYSGLPLIRYQVRKQEKQKSESWNFKDLLFRCATRMVGAEKLLTPLFWLLVISLLTAVFLLPFGVVELEELAASSFFILVLTGYGMKFFASFVAAKVFDRMLRDGEFELVAVTPVHGERFLLQFGEAFSRIFRDFFSKLFSVLLVLLLLVSVASLDAGSISGIVGLLVWALYLAADIGALIWMSMHGVLKGRSPRSSILYGLFMVQIVPYLVLIVPFCGFFLLAFSPLWSLWLMSHHRRQLLWNFRKFVRDRTVASV